jgi:hypothetical protein
LCVLTNTVNNVPYLEAVLSQLGRIGVAPFVEQVKRIRGYSVGFGSEDQSLYFFKKYPDMRALRRKKWMVIRKGKLELVDEEPLLIFMDYDAGILLQGSELADETICIFNVRKFESLFSFYHYYRNKLEQAREKIPVLSFLDNSNTFLNYCIKDPRKLRKMYTILETGDLDKMDLDTLNDAIAYYHVDLDYDRDGKITVDENKIWEILSLLDDDYVQSTSTGNKYEARSKVKR